jgi:hypothetical protein
VFLRLLVAIMVGLSIGLGLYFGGVTLYRIAVGRCRFKRLSIRGD